MSIVVETSCGKVQGQQESAHQTFRGIPYARPPLAELRFRPPEPCEPWTGVLTATAFGPLAMQGASFAPGTEVEGQQSEDCLHLNVFTRATGERKRPVLVFIHGGAFTVGSSSVPIYDGGPLAELGDVVVVTFNYRLGSFGFLYLGEMAARIDAAHNLAHLDQIAALRWVRDNIAAFGGDPDNVTLFGESAGATSVCALMVAPAARGLFRRAISQSSALAPTFASHAQAEQTTARLFGKLGLTLSEAHKLRELPAQRLIEAQRAVENEGLIGVAFFSVLDDATLPLQPQAALAAGRASHIPLLIGSNRDEWNLFDAASIAFWDKPMSDDEALAKLTRKLGDAERAQRMLRIYRGSRTRNGLRSDTRALLRAIDGDLRFRIPSLRFAELHAAQGAPTFMYLFNYPSPALRGVLGACHALELPFVFGTLAARGQDRFAGSGPGPEALSNTMMRCWLSFAEHGTPTHAGGFPPFSPPARPTLVFDLETRLEQDPLGDERAAWEGVL